MQMHHLVAPLDPDHRRAVRLLIRYALGPAGAPQQCGPLWPPHLTLVSYQELAFDAAVDAVRPVAASTVPFVVRAHGYGIFTGDAPSQLCLFVPVVRDAALDRLQRRLRAALKAAGATVDGQSRPGVWTPHVTLMDRCLDPSRLAEVVGRLARRPHPSWSIRLGGVELHRTTLRFAGTPGMAGALGTGGAGGAHS